MTATYWLVEVEQGPKWACGVRTEALQRLSSDLTRRFGRGVSVDNLELMRLLYLSYRPIRISESPIRDFGLQQLEERTKSWPTRGQSVYSYKDSVRAVRLYLKAGKRIRATIKQLGYPTINSLQAWHREYEKSPALRAG